MGLTIETFSNVKGGNSFYKAVSHPAAAAKAAKLIDELRNADAVAIYDPLGLYAGFTEFFDPGDVTITETYIQDIETIGTIIADHPARPVTELGASTADILFIAAFDSELFQAHIDHLVRSGMKIISFDDMRLDDTLLTNRRDYLAAENFATNFAFFRDRSGLSTRIATANCWANYGAASVSLHLMLFDEDGAVLAEWNEALPEKSEGFTIDSRDIRKRFGLDDFTGQLFIHAVGVKGHDVVKYALDVWRDDGTELTCTHDANAWPSDQYAGLPAPDDGEEVVLWVQNSHPCPIPAGAVGLNLMGDDRLVTLDEAVPPFGTCRLSVADLLPDASWPQQIEVQAGKYFVRPRYEITGENRRRMAHVNVERADLVPDPKIAELGNLMGKGFILPAPVLPTGKWRSMALPTPMAATQANLPVAALLLDAEGNEIKRHTFGCLPRNHTEMLDISTMLKNGADLPDTYGHWELVYDFSDGGEADGWLHALFRYEDIESGHGAETSFGAHVFNTVLTYKGEPQSYTRRPPGLSTRLFLRIGPEPLDTLCHLIYPASTPWHATSETALWLIGAGGETVAEASLQIPCGGSRLWRVSELFDDDTLHRAGDNPYIVVRDTTCRLFGYHGLLSATGAFSLDHMFGF